MTQSSPSPSRTASSSDSGRTGLVIAALALGGFTIGVVEFATMSLVPYFSRDLGVDPARASHAISAYALGVVVGAPTLAVLGARAPRKALLVALMAAYGLANLAAAMALSFHAFLGFRFLAGFPHGAYFGVAALMAASLVPQNKRAWAISMVMVGLTVATVLGVPFASVIAQYATWRAGLGTAAVLAFATAALVAIFAPATPAPKGANPFDELSALRDRSVLLPLAVGAVGFGGMFAVYTYVANTLLEVTHAPAWSEPMVFMVFGTGMVLGTLATGRVADRGLLKTAAWLLALMVVALLIYPSTVHSLWAMTACLFVIGAVSAIGLPLQTYLMDVAGKAQTMAAAMHHAAFNTANALGPLLASLVVEAGWGYPATGYVGAALSCGGLFLVWMTMRDSRRRFLEGRSGPV